MKERLQQAIHQLLVDTVFQQFSNMVGRRLRGLLPNLQGGLNFSQVDFRFSLHPCLVFTPELRQHGLELNLLQ